MEYLISAHVDISSLTKSHKASLIVGLQRLCLGNRKLLNTALSPMLLEPNNYWRKGPQNQCFLFC